MGVGDAARERQVAAVNATFFDFFDIRPVLGRLFVVAEDSTPRGASVALLSYNYWKTEFGGRNVIGQVLQVGNIQCVIIGVTPEGFVGVAATAPAARRAERRKNARREVDSNSSMVRSFRGGS